MIEINNISKSYGRTEALKNISLNIDEGKIFGLIGPDGAGKSTLFRILTTLLIPDNGSAKLNSWDTVKDYKVIRNNIGYMPGKFSLYKDLTVEENLEFFAKVFNTTIDENYDMIKDIYVLLEPFKDRRAGDLSGGMKQKLALSCALIHKPKILLLDEPTFGVDPVSRKELWDNLKKLQKNDNLTILVSTPYMDEASLCDEVALIQNGEILATDTPENISKSFSNELFELRSGNNYKTLMLLRENNIGISSFMFGNSIHISLEKGKSPQLIEDFLDAKEVKYSLTKIEANIEDAFMSLMN